MSNQAVDSIPGQVPVSRALFWKEFRQVMPLLLTVLGMGFGTLLMILIATALASGKSIAYDSSYWFLFLAMPMMYATGVGILVVGADKESRTLNWLRSLPIQSKDIALSKLLAAVLSLALVWLVAWSSWAVFAGSLGVSPWKSQSMDIYSMNAGDWLLPTYVMVSLFLCLAGLAFAWRFESQILSLVLLIPAALAIWCLSYGIATYLTAGKSDLEFRNLIDSGVYLMSLAIGSLIALIYGWRASQWALGAMTAPKQESNAWFSTTWSAVTGLLIGETSQERFSEGWATRPTVTPLGGMLWQMIQQNGRWWLLIGLLSLIVLLGGMYNGMIGHLGSIDGSISDAWIFYVVIPLGLLSGLLGVLAFQSDGIEHRVRFYADRGVSPTLLWVTRHWIPVTILMGTAFVRFITLRMVHGSSSSWFMVDTAVLFAISLCSYTVGQWVSQFIKSPILSAIVLPGVLFTQYVYCIFMVILMESPWWLLTLCFAIGALATWWMMRPWMERRIDWKYYLQHMLFSLTALIIPLIPGLWKIWNLPNMPSELRGSLVSLAMQNSPVRQDVLSLPQPYLQSLSFGDKQESGQSVLAYNESIREKQKNELLKQARSLEYWVASQELKKSLEAYIAELAALQSSLEPFDANSKKDLEVSLGKYREAMAAIPDLVKMLRATKRLRICDAAERIELIAFGHCKHSQAKEWMGESVYESILELLGDDQARDQSRRVALAVAWWVPEPRYNRPRLLETYGLDGYPINYSNKNRRYANSDSVPASIAMLRSRDLYVADLWKLLELPTGSEEAASFRNTINTRNGFGSSIPISGKFFATETYSLYSPGETWRGEWEAVAKQLSSKGVNP